MFDTTSPRWSPSAGRWGRRYSLSVDGSLFDPADFNAIGVYNPRNLAHDARAVAQFIADTFKCEVVVVKHLKTGDRDDVTVWAAR